MQIEKAPPTAKTYSGNITAKLLELANTEFDEASSLIDETSPLIDEVLTSNQPPYVKACQLSSLGLSFDRIEQTFSMGKIFAQMGQDLWALVSFLFDERYYQVTQDGFDYLQSHDLAPRYITLDQLNMLLEFHWENAITQPDGEDILTSDM